MEAKAKKTLFIVGVSALGVLALCGVCAKFAPPKQTSTPLVLPTASNADPPQAPSVKLPPYSKVGTYKPYDCSQEAIMFAVKEDSTDDALASLANHLLETNPGFCRYDITKTEDSLKVASDFFAISQPKDNERKAWHTWQAKNLYGTAVKQAIIGETKQEPKVSFYWVFWSIEKGQIAKLQPPLTKPINVDVDLAILGEKNSSEIMLNVSITNKTDFYTNDFSLNCQPTSKDNSFERTFCPGGIGTITNLGGTRLRCDYHETISPRERITKKIKYTQAAFDEIECEITTIDGNKFGNQVKKVKAKVVTN